jgi:hypothetical protein
VDSFHLRNIYLYYVHEDLHLLPLGAGCSSTFIIGLQFTSFALITEKSYKMENKEITNRTIENEELEKKYALTFVPFVKKERILFLKVAEL